MEPHFIFEEFLFRFPFVLGFFLHDDMDLRPSLIDVLYAGFVQFISEDEISIGDTVYGTCYRCYFIVQDDYLFAFFVRG